MTTPPAVRVLRMPVMADAVTEPQRVLHSLVERPGRVVTLQAGLVHALLVHWSFQHQVVMCDLSTGTCHGERHVRSRHVTPLMPSSRVPFRARSLLYVFG